MGPADSAFAALVILATVLIAYVAIGILRRARRPARPPLAAARPGAPLTGPPPPPPRAPGPP